MEADLNYTGFISVISFQEFEKFKSGLFFSIFHYIEIDQLCLYLSKYCNKVSECKKLSFFLHMKIKTFLFLDFQDPHRWCGTVCANPENYNDDQKKQCYCSRKRGKLVIASKYHHIILTVILVINFVNKETFSKTSTNK